ncbi:MAG: signal peptidase II [Proteobacteria bacterium]|nr:signal peptidase II [Pseudomonadota bacterium]
MNSLSPTIPQPPANRLWLLPTLLFFTICSDQLTKYMARNMLVSSMETSFLNGLVKFSLVENHGGFLGIVSNLPDGLRYFFLNICVAALLFGCLVYLLWFSGQSSRTWSPLALITGGGLSNLLDRFIGHGGVTDFMILGTGYLQTGIFNLADVFILSGSFFLGFRLFQHNGK